MDIYIYTTMLVNVLFGGFHITSLEAVESSLVPTSHGFILGHGLPWLRRASVYRITIYNIYIYNH